MNKDSRIFIADKTRLEGQSLIHYLKDRGYTNIITTEIDLTGQSAVRNLFFTEKPEYVFLAAGRMGGIIANQTYPAEFIYSNLQIQNNVIHFAWQSQVKKLIFLASSCVYPRVCPQPMKEEYLLTGPLEPTSEPYAIAKIAGMRMCQSYNRQYHTNFVSVIPDNLYGPHDDFNPETAHVLASLIHKFHDAKTKEKSSITLWGSGTPRRGFMYIDDLADACVFLMDNYNSSEIINIGYGEDMMIKDLALLVKDIVGFSGDVVFDKTKPDGTIRKLLDTDRLSQLGWQPKVSLEEGIRKTYQWYRNQCISEDIQK